MIGRSAVAPCTDPAASSSARRAARRSTWIWLLAGLLAGTFALPGCSGCRQDPQSAKKKADEEEEAKKNKGKPKPDFEVTQLNTYPDDPDQLQNLVKPGHWVTVMQQVRANNFDFQADLELATTDRDGRSFPVENTEFEVAVSRPAPLPKGQTKTFELTMYVPRVQRSANLNEAKTVWFESRLKAARAGNRVNDGREGTTELESHEFFFVVLASNPNNYRFLKVLDAVTPPDHGADSGRSFHYRVVLPKAGDVVTVPSNSLTWTSTAIVLWDKLDPQSLSPDQQQALLDWVHWGGQLIINGPGSLENLQNSFLANYLPAERLQAAEFGLERLKDLNDYWSIPSAKDPNDTRRIQLKAGQTLLGIDWKLHPEASFLPNTSELVCERRVGGGRVVATALPLDEPPVREWKSFDHFLNSCLLRRPGRDFRLLARLDEQTSKPQWVGFNVGPAEPRLNSTVRFFARDLAAIGPSPASTLPASPSATDPSPPMSTAKPTSAAIGATPTATPQPAEVGFPPGASAQPGVPSSTPGIPQVTPNPYVPPVPAQFSANRSGSDNSANSSTNQLAAYNDLNDWRFRGMTADKWSGVGGWSDSSGVPTAVREAIAESAGIKIPEAKFVLRILLIYLVVLVPANWLVFRLLGRVEWAWIAVPVIALAGAITVIRMAQLDIGFVRSRREIAVLELQGGYPRGHLARFSLLYSSLSTGYDVAFEDQSAIAQPFSKGGTTPRGPGSATRAMHLRRDDQVRLRNFLVSSNSTELLHSEQMFPLAGPLSLEGNDDDGWQLVNDSELTLRDVGLVRKTADGKNATAWIGELAKRSKTPIKFVALDDEQPWVAEWNESTVTSRTGPGAEGEIRLHRLIELATQKMALGPGDIRLVGWTDDDIGGVTFRPGAAQTTFRTIAVCHLRRGALPDLIRDINVRTDFYAPKVEPETEDEVNPVSNPPDKP